MFDNDRRALEQAYLRAQPTETDAADLPRVFERFYTGTQSRADGHTGLGLAISKSIIEAHSGIIEVASRENSGSTFTIRLPLQTDDHKTVPTNTAPAGRRL